ncbi:hypothetical protein ACVWU4_000891 [Campylobacter coli]
MYFVDLSKRNYTYIKEMEDLNNILKRTYDEVLANKISKYEASMVLAKYHDAYFSISNYPDSKGMIASPYDFFSKSVIKASGVSNSAIIDYLSVIYTDKQHINFNKYLSLNFSNQFTITTEKLYEFSTIDTNADVKLEIPLYIKEGYEKEANLVYTYPLVKVLRKIGLLEAIRAYLSLPIILNKEKG